MKMHTIRGTANLRTGQVENTVDTVETHRVEQPYKRDSRPDFEMMEDYMKTVQRQHAEQMEQPGSLYLDTIRAIHERIENPDEPLEPSKPAIMEHYGTVRQCAEARRAQAVDDSGSDDDVPDEMLECDTGEGIPEAPKPLDAADLMADAIETYRARGAVYGKSYDRQGDIMQALFPGRVELETIEDHRRFGVLTIMISKLARYCNNFHTGGHRDSVHDLGVYAFILEELDSRKREDTE